MFCLMDVSGSMDEARKDLAKRFFILLYLFLTRHYEQTEVVFIRHHTQAAEVTEDEFFHATESGGTVVSSALTLMNEIIRERYMGSEWNIYGAQASDGDNWQQDSSKCRELLDGKLLPLVRYFAYVQVADEDQNLWEEYTRVRDANAQLRDAEDRHARADLPGVPRPVQEEPGGSDMMKHELLDEPAPMRGAKRLPSPSDWTFELIETYFDAHPRARPSASGWTPIRCSWS